jgi:hypothetical protein
MFRYFTKISLLCGKKFCHATKIRKNRTIRLKNCHATKIRKKWHNKTQKLSRDKKILFRCFAGSVVIS